ncbi:MAG: hypothetical protein ACR2OH_04215, partial [Microthrixaceae bacterium]
MNTRVIVGLPHARAAWPAELSRWATSGTAPVEFLTCLTANELKALLGSGRQIDVVLLDAASAQVDSDLVGLVRAAGPVAVGIEATSSPTDWDSWGATAHLAAQFTWLQLADLIAAHCSPIKSAGGASNIALGDGSPRGGFLVGVCGPGGTGASTVAMALAQGAASREGVSTILVDGARRADLAMYHDTA